MRELDGITDAMDMSLSILWGFPDDEQGCLRRGVRVFESIAISTFTLTICVSKLRRSTVSDLQIYTLPASSSPNQALSYSDSLLLPSACGGTEPRLSVVWWMGNRPVTEAGSFQWEE